MPLSNSASPSTDSLAPAKSRSRAETQSQGVSWTESGRAGERESGRAGDREARREITLSHCPLVSHSPALPLPLSSFPLCVSTRLRRFVFIPFRINHNAPVYASLPARRRGKRRIDRIQTSPKSPRLRRVIIACNRRNRPQPRCGLLTGLPLRTARRKRLEKSKLPVTVQFDTPLTADVSGGWASAGGLTP